MKGLFKSLLLVAGMVCGSQLAAAAEPAAWPIDQVVGKADAPNTIIEYSSLGCPHCAVFHAETWPKLKTEWIDTGKAKIIFRDFPLDGRALAAAMVAQCSNDHYLAFVDAYFRTQKSWEQAEDGLTAIKGIAKLGGMGDAQVEACWQRADLLKQINDRKDEATSKFGIDSTPTFLINGKKVNGAVPYDSFIKDLK